MAAAVLAPAAALAACGGAGADAPGSADGSDSDAPALDTGAPTGEGGAEDRATSDAAAADAPGAEASPPVDWSKEVRFFASIDPSVGGGYTFRVEPPGGLVPSQTEIASGVPPQMIVVTPSMKFAYVPLGTGNALSGLRVAPDSLARLDFDPGTVGTQDFTAVGQEPRFACVDPSSKHLYVTSFGAASVSALAIDDDGMLSAAAPAAATLDGPQACAVDPAGKFLFVAARTASQVSVFAIGAKGALSGRKDFAVPADPIALVVHPTAKVVYVASAAANTIGAYTYAAADGALTANGSVTPGKGASPKPMALAITPSGDWLYSSNNAEPLVNVWSVNAAGALAPAGTADVLTGGRAVTVDPGGAWLFVHTDDATIHVFDIDASSGALSAHPNALGGGTNPWADAVFHTGLKVK